MMFFGLQWDFERNRWEDDVEGVNKQILETIKGRVTQFLTGGGLREPQNTAEKPRLFCSGAPFEKQESGRAARDINGKDIVTARDDNTGLPTEYLTIDRAFSTQQRGGNNVFWVPAFNGYDFSRRDSICSSPLPDGKVLLGRVARPTSSGLFDYFNGEKMVKYNMGKTNRHMILCPAAFASRGGGHSVVSLSETVGSLYPSNFGSADTSKALDRMMTRGSTFYHELFHLTDNDDTLRGEGQENYNLADIAKAVKEDINRRIKLAHNPESYVLLAQALHMYRSPPEGKRRVLYGVSFPMNPESFGHNEDRWRAIAGLP
ncbi:hypothetical protein D7B24_005292 [Verticillium nonalfalfae]|uniref:Uncharacterized protein n=1 Tax=Verticillium nonalfalfae TaxID=1051616 RepID=A0A3M9YBS3_9PEZI|nr:uncharacterized protein D7B24_005292 [Verticillium nonalfalfae]RNJ57977.1 hypothetical protein D7B24_005292 [Verticillium nonalfalfae]